MAIGRQLLDAMLDFRRYRNMVPSDNHGRGAYSEGEEPSYGYQSVVFDDTDLPELESIDNDDHNDNDNDPSFMDCDVCGLVVSADDAVPIMCAWCEGLSGSCCGECRTHMEAVGYFECPLCDEATYFVE
jgi:hypothetical protein